MKMTLIIYDYIININIIYIYILSVSIENMNELINTTNKIKYVIQD